jgi:hypothetical protein
VTFLGAVHWGVALATPLTSRIAVKIANEAFVYSVIPSLCAWPVALMEPGRATCSSNCHSKGSTYLSYVQEAALCLHVDTSSTCVHDACSNCCALYTQPFVLLRYAQVLVLWCCRCCCLAAT